MASENILIEFNADVDGLRPAIDTLVKIGTLTEKDAQEFEKVNKAYRERVVTANAMASAQSKVTAESAKGAKSMDDLAKSAKAVSETIIKGATNEAIKKTNDEVKKYDNSLKGLKAQYKELLSIAIANGETSPIGKQALKDAGELKDRIGDLSQATKNLGSDTKGFDAIAGGLTTVSAGFQAVTGAQALFGNGGEELQKKLVQLQAVMALTNGLQQIQAGLQKETAFRQGLTAISTKALAVATGGYNLVVGASTGVMKAFRIALASTGIGLLVIGLIALVENFGKVKDFVVNTINKFEFLKKAIEPLIFAFNALKDVLGFGEDAVEQAEKAGKALDALSDKLERAKKRELALRQSLNQNTLAEEKKVGEVQLKLIEAQNEQALLLFRKRYLEEGKLSEENSKQLTESLTALNDKKLELQVRSNEIDTDLSKQALEASLKNTENKLRFAKKGSEQELAFKVATNLALQKLEIANINATTETEALKQSKIKEAQQKRIEADKQASQDYFAFQLNLKKQEVDNQLLITGGALESELALKLKALNIDKDIALNNYKLTSEERLLIETNFQNKRVELNKTYGEKIKAELLKQTNEQFDKAVKQEEINQAKFKADSQYLEDLAQLEANYTNDSLGKKIALEQAIRSQKIATFILEKDNIQALADLEQGRLDTQLANNLITETDYADKTKALKEKTNADILANERETNLAIIEDAKKTEQEKKELFLQTVDTIQNLSNQTLQVIGEYNNQQLQNNLDNIKAEENALNKKHQNGLLNEKEFAFQKEQLAKKERQARADALKKEKQIKRFEVLVNTATSIAKTASNVGYPLAIPLIALAAVQGALQLSAIDAQKIPEFAKGTKYAPKGWAWVGEQGPELISLRGGEEIKTHKQSIDYAKMKFGNNYNIPKDTLFNKIERAPQLNTELLKLSSTGVSIDYEKLSKLIGSEVNNSISKMPLTHFTMDRNGFSVAVSNGNSKVNYLDNRYSSN